MAEKGKVNTICSSQLLKYVQPKPLTDNSDVYNSVIVTIYAQSLCRVIYKSSPGGVRA